MNTARAVYLAGSLCFVATGCAGGRSTPDDPIAALDMADATALARRGHDAQAMTRQAPDNPAGWSLLAEYRRETGDTQGTVEAACRAASLLPSMATYGAACGDALQAAGNAAGAVEQWRKAILVSADRTLQFDLLDQISRTSLQPETDLRSLPPELLEQYRLWKWAQWQKDWVCPPWGCEPRPIYCGVR